jgi:hypothetical protein
VPEPLRALRHRGHDRRGARRAVLHRVTIRQLAEELRGIEDDDAGTDWRDRAGSGRRQERGKNGGEESSW